jgi:hypothetical protein
MMKKCEWCGKESSRRRFCDHVCRRKWNKYNVPGFVEREKEKSRKNNLKHYKKKYKNYNKKIDTYLKKIEKRYRKIVVDINGNVFKNATKAAEFHNISFDTVDRSIVEGKPYKKILYFFKYHNLVR